MAGRRFVTPALVAVLVLAFAAFVGGGVNPAGAASACSPTVTTDKPDYGPGDIVHVSGTGYTCWSAVTVKIVSPINAVWTDTVAPTSTGTIAASYPIPAVHSYGKYYLSVLDANGNVLAKTTFLDTHFRYGAISWQRPSLTSLTVTFTLQAAFRAGYFTTNCGGQPYVGEVIPSTCGIGAFNFGDNSATNFNLTVTSVDLTNDVMQGFTTITHTYATAGTFTAFWTDCCRLSTLQNNHDTAWNIQTLVNLNPTNGAVQSPTSQLPAVTDCAVGAVCTIPIPVADSDPNAVAFTYRLSTPTEMGGAGSGETQPPGSTIDPNTGVFMWNSAGHGAAGDLWNASVIVEARNSVGAIIATAELDFLIHQVTGVPPTFVTPPSPTNGSTLNDNVNNQLSITVEATSSAGRPVTISSIQTISGVTLSCPAAAVTITCTYTWTPTLNDTGSHLVSFVATDSTGARSSTLNVTIVVPKIVVTVTADNQSIIYGQPDPATFTFHSSGFLGTDTFTTQPTCGVTGPHSAAGDYAITCSGGAVPTGYTINYVAGNLHVGQQQLVVTPDNQSITYGDPDPSFTFTTSGFVGTDTWVTQPSCGVTGAHANVGPYTITCSGGDAGPNYTIGYGSATLTVNPKKLIVTADDQGIIYGSADPTFTFTPSGFVGADAFVTSPTCGVTGPHANVGTYTITCSGGDAGPNYTIQYVSGTLTVSARTIVVTPDDQMITYGDADPAFTFTNTPFAGTDTFTTVPTCGVSGPHSNAGTYTITCSGGAVGSNYTIQYATGTLTINRKLLTVTAENQSKVYGTADPNFTFEVSGFVGTDGFVMSPTCGVSAAHSNVGQYAITCSGADAGGNYTIKYVDGTLDVTPATITITANDQHNLPGQPDPAFTFTVSGLVGSDSLITAPTCGVTGSHSAPGTYVITCSGAVASSNYTIKYVDGTLTVAKATPMLNTFPSSSVPVGGLISDRAAVTGGFNPTGPVTFTLYAPGDLNCATPIATQTVQLAGGSASASAVLATKAGVYNWIASYGGNPQNNAVSGSCGDERVLVTPQVLTGRAYGLTLKATLGTSTLLNIKPTPDTGFIDTTNSTTTAPPCVSSIAGLVGVAPLCARVVTSAGYPAKSTATATVGAVTISISGVPAIVLRTVTSTASTTCGGSTGSVTIAYLKVGTTVLINKPTLIAPNRVIRVGSLKLVLNEQTHFATPDTGLLVNAVHVTLNVVGHPVVNAVVASAESDINNCP